MIKKIFRIEKKTLDSRQRNKNMKKFPKTFENLINGPFLNNRPSRAHSEALHDPEVPFLCRAGLSEARHDPKVPFPRRAGLSEAWHDPEVPFLCRAGLSKLKLSFLSS